MHFELCIHTRASLEMDEVYCFGCGVDLTAKSTERRKLMEDSETSQRVKQAWKKLVADKFAGAADIDIERLASGAKLCRKCFLAFDCLVSTASVLQQWHSPCCARTRHVLLLFMTRGYYKHFLVNSIIA